MTPSLERLEEMVRLAEARSRVRKLDIEARAAADGLRQAEAAMRDALRLLNQQRPALQRESAEIDNDETRLRDLVRKVTHLISLSAITIEQRDVFLKEIEATRAEIEQRRLTSRTELEAIQKATAEAKRQLLAAMEHYRQQRHDIDRIQPELSASFAADDQLVRTAEELFLSGQIRALHREVEAQVPQFAALDRREQLAQLMVWIGRLKRVQSSDLGDVTPEELEILKRIFPRLVSLSKEYEPGYIEAFRQSYTTDWDVYIQRAEEQLRAARERVRGERESRDRPGREPEGSGGPSESLKALAALLERHLLPEEGVAEFQEAVRAAFEGSPGAEGTLLGLVEPHLDLLTGPPFRALRRLAEQQLGPARSDEDPPLEELNDLLPRTRGARVLMVGGVAREELRRGLRRLFGFEELDWEPHDERRPAQADRLAEFLREGGIDLVLAHRELVGHPVGDLLNRISRQARIPLLIVEETFAPLPIAEALRSDWAANRREEADLPNGQSPA